MNQKDISVSKTKFDIWFTRFLSLAGADAVTTINAKWSYFLTFLFTYFVSEYWHFVFGIYEITPEEKKILIGMAVLVTTSFILLLLKATRTALLLLWSTLVFKIYWTFPMTPNHRYLEFIIISLAVFLNPQKKEEKSLFFQTCRWLTIIIFIYTGIQKILYGLYFQGEFLALMISQNTRFAQFFQWIIPPTEWTRLTNFANTYTIGSGPFTMDSILFKLASNLSYLLEIILPCLLLIKKIRPYAIGLALLFFILIELAAREYYFGILISGLMLLFFEQDVYKKTIPVFITLYLYFLCTWMGIFPKYYFN